MTTAAQPQPYPGDLATALPGTVSYRREYRDALGRPLAGSVTLTGQKRSTHGNTVTLPVPVVATLTEGVLDVNLPPDTYQLIAALRTIEGARVTDEDTITLT